MIRSIRRVHRNGLNHEGGRNERFYGMSRPASPLRCQVLRYFKRFPGATAAGRELVASFGREKRTALRAVLVANLSGYLLDNTVLGW